MGFYADAIRKLTKPLDESGTTHVIETCASFVDSPTSLDTVRRALHIHSRFCLSPWDALIVGAATEAGCGSPRTRRRTRQHDRAGSGRHAGSGQALASAKGIDLSALVNDLKKQNR